MLLRRDVERLLQMLSRVRGGFDDEGVRAGSDADAVIEDGMIADGEHLVSVEYLGQVQDSGGGCGRGLQENSAVNCLSVDEAADINVGQNSRRRASLINLVHLYLDRRFEWALRIVALNGDAMPAN